MLAVSAPSCDCAGQTGTTLTAVFVGENLSVGSMKGGRDYTLSAVREKESAQQPGKGEGKSGFFHEREPNLLCGFINEFEEALKMLETLVDRCNRHLMIAGISH